MTDATRQHYRLATGQNVTGMMKGGAVKQKTMDTGVQPARKGRSQQDVEAGGTPKLKPGYMKGGKAHGYKHGGYKHGGSRK